VNARYIFCSTLARNEILTATSEYSCYNKYTKLWVSKRKSETQDGGLANSVAQISARIRDSNEIATATPMFPGLGNTDRLLGILSHVWVCWKSEMAAINRK